MTNEKLETPVQYLKGVGPKLAKIVGKLGLKTVFDVLYFVPREYEDRTQIKPIGRLTPADNAIIKGEIVSLNNQITRNRFSVLKVLIGDKSGYIEAVWFNQPYLAGLFRKGMKLIVSGRVELSEYSGTRQLVVREFEIDTGENLKFVPRYPLTEGLYPKKIREIVKTAVTSYLAGLPDRLTAVIKTKYNLLDLRAAISKLHFPDNLAEAGLARTRLAFDDFFFFQLGLLLRQKKLLLPRALILRLIRLS